MNPVVKILLFVFASLLCFPSCSKEQEKALLPSEVSELSEKTDDYPALSAKEALDIPGLRSFYTLSFSSTLASSSETLPDVQGCNLFLLEQQLSHGVKQRLSLALAVRPFLNKYCFLFPFHYFW